MYVDIYSNALSMDYNDEREESQFNCVTTKIKTISKIFIKTIY